MNILEIKKCTIRFGGLTALTALDLCLEEGRITGLIGPNGAGKTTAFNLITGIYPPTEGDILLNGKSIRGFPPHRVNHAGIARTFQNIRLFKNMTVLDNVISAMHRDSRASWLGTLLTTDASRADRQRLESTALEWLDTFRLAEHSGENAGSLAYGQQRRLEIVRALATRPKLLLLDEPAAGMNPQEKTALKELIRDVRTRFNVTIFIIEHDMNVMMELCERIAVLDYGVKIAEGTPAEIRATPTVIKAYLGEEP